MCDVITLSSDDELEVESRPRKRLKLATYTTEEAAYIVLSDDDDCKEVKQEIAAAPQESAVNGVCIEENTNSSVECIELAMPNDCKEPQSFQPNDEVEACEDITEKESTMETENVCERANTTDLENGKGLETTKLIENAEEIENVKETENTKKTNETEETEDSLVANNSVLVNEGKTGTSLESSVENEFLACLDKCMQTLQKPQHKELVTPKLPIIKKLYEKAALVGRSLDEFREVIRSSSKKIDCTPELAIVSFTDLYQWLKSRYAEAQTEDKSAERHRKIIKKLEKTLLIVRQKIKKLDEAEVNFDDEDDSVYIQAARYKDRAAKIYAKLCHYRKEDPHYGSILHCRLDFCRSNYTEINRALNKKYRNNSVFPTFCDVDKCIRKCVVEKGLQIGEDELRVEIKRCFEELGNLLQRRRQLDLSNCHSDYIRDSTDPALQDPAVECELRAHYAEAQQKRTKILEHYVQMQESNANPVVSSESDDSHIAESNDEDGEAT